MAYSRPVSKCVEELRKKMDEMSAKVLTMEGLSAMAFEKQFMDWVKNDGPLSTEDVVVCLETTYRFQWAGDVFLCYEFNKGV